jgi:hypothetical protein
MREWLFYCPLFVCLFVSSPTSTLSNVVIVLRTVRCETIHHNRNKLYKFIVAYFFNVDSLLLLIIFLMAPVSTFSIISKPTYFPIKIIVLITKFILEMFKFISLVLPCQVWLSFLSFHIIWSSIIRVGVVTERWAWLKTNRD